MRKIKLSRLSFSKSNTFLGNNAQTRLFKICVNPACQVTFHSIRVLNGQRLFNNHNDIFSFRWQLLALV